MSENRSSIAISVEAIEVYQETGLTPRQLIDRNRELVEACKIIIKALKHAQKESIEDGGKVGAYITLQEWEILEQTISKSEPKGK